jgi:hypothetical protein
MSRKSLFLIKNMLIGNNLARIKSYHDVVVCMVGGMVDIEFRGKGMSYMVDRGVVWKLMVDFLIPVNNAQMAICDNLVSVMKNVFGGRGWGYGRYRV